MADKKKSIIPTIILSIISLIWIYPIVMILFNSLKVEQAITTSGVFKLPTSETWNGIQNFITSVTQLDFLQSFWYSLVISVMSVVLILLCCSMCAWYIVRVNGLFSKILYYLCVFSMVVPFQMVMFTLAKTADTLKLNNPYTICIVYLGFGAGLAVFMFTGFVKGSPLEIEEAAMIDGCGPFRILTSIIIPMCKPGIVTVCMISAMAAWNEYPVALVMVTDPTKATLPVGLANLYEIQRYATDWGALFAALVLALIPTVILFIVGQKQLVQGLSVGGVKG